MTSQLDVAKGREIVVRWRNLAEQRLQHLTELFDSGRWRRYYGEQAFLENIREAKTAVEAWRDLATREATPDNRPIDLSWLGRRRTAPPPNELPRGLIHLPRIAEISVAPQEVPIVGEQDNGASETHPVEPLSEASFAAVLDLTAIAARYPILRNTL
jgi:hypothetical protein